MIRRLSDALNAASESAISLDSATYSLSNSGSASPAW